MSAITQTDRPPTFRREHPAAAKASAILRRLNRPVVAILAVGLIAGYLRFMHLGYPDRTVFDEYYYPKSACIFLGYDNETCRIRSADERFWLENEWDTGAFVHPPVGKWMIALGELAFGVDPFGWRVGAAVTGTLTVMLLAGIVQLLWASPIWTFAGGLLLATESLNFVQSRTGILDIFVAFWIVLGFLLLLLDKRWIERRTPDPSVPPGVAGDGDPPRRRRLPAPLWRPWRFAAGAALGAGVATKWSGLMGIFAAVALSFGWEVVRRKRFGSKSPLLNTITAEGFGLVLAYLLLPFVVYVASYTAWFLHFGFDLGRWVELQGSMARFHTDLPLVNEEGQPSHGYLSTPWQWIFLRRPVFYYGVYSEGFRQVIYANGNPAIFWGSILAIPYVAYAWWRRRDWRAGYIVVAIAGLYLPWFLVSRPQFLFYATPITPFFVLACLYALRDLSELRVAGSRSRPFLPVAVGFVAASVLLFIWFWPVLTGAPITDAAFKLRLWFTTWV
jgi:dolichyl-phosphate-mannose--protein O-mannosyl transferase